MAIQIINGINKSQTPVFFLQLKRRIKNQQIPFQSLCVVSFKGPWWYLSKKSPFGNISAATRSDTLYTYRNVGEFLVITWILTNLISKHFWSEVVGRSFHDVGEFWRMEWDHFPPIRSFTGYLFQNVLNSPTSRWADWFVHLYPGEF